MEEKVVKPQTGTPAPAPTVADAPVVEAESHVEQLQKLTDAPNEQKQVDVDSLIPSDPYYMDPLFYEVANYFGLEQEDYDAAKNKLSDIVEYVIRQNKSNSPETVLKAIRQMEQSIQPPSWDEKRYTNVHKYVRLAAKKGTIEQAMKAFEKEGLNGN